MRKHLFVAVVSMALTASSALAGDLVTPLLRVGSDHIATCRLLNVSTAPTSAHVQLVGAINGVLSDSSSAAVQPGQSLTASAPGPNDFVYCRFVKASKSKTRCALDIGGTLADTTEETVIPAY
jgi:hypothetical protein